MIVPPDAADTFRLLSGQHLQSQALNHEYVGFEKIDDLCSRLCNGTCLRWQATSDFYFTLHVENTSPFQIDPIAR